MSNLSHTTSLCNQAIVPYTYSDIFLEIVKFLLSSLYRLSSCFASTIKLLLKQIYNLFTLISQQTICFVENVVIVSKSYFTNQMATFFSTKGSMLCKENTDGLVINQRLKVLHGSNLIG